MITLTRDPGEFAQATRALFDSRVECNLMATVLAGVLAGRYASGAPLFAYGPADGEVTWAALRTPPWDMLTTEIPLKTVAELVRRWLDEDPELPGVNGPAATTGTIATVWVAQTGGEVSCRLREAAYVLDEVRDPPRPAPGELRLALEAERPLMRDWMRAFARESKALPEDRAPWIVDTRAAEGGLWVWDHGGPVSMLGTAPLIAGTVRVGPVYTPPERRRRGYAGTAVAAASREALRRGARRLTLYTDLSNPTSNKIYAEVGYRRTGEHWEWGFVKWPQPAE